MNELRQFALQITRVVLGTIFIVGGVAFVTIPWNLSGHRGDIQASTTQRHLSLGGDAGLDRPAAGEILAGA